MIKVVVDANVILSGMIGHYDGHPRQIINLALTKKLLIYGSKQTFEEFCEKIKITRLQKFLIKRLFTPEKIILDYKSFVNMTEPYDILKDVSISRDKDDDVYVRTAKACGSQILITGDKDLLDLKKYDGVVMVKPADFLASFYKLKKG